MTKVWAWASAARTRRAAANAAKQQKIAAADYFIKSLYAMILPFGNRSLPQAIMPEWQKEYHRILDQQEAEEEPACRKALAPSL